MIKYHYLYPVTGRGREGGQGQERRSGQRRKKGQSPGTARGQSLVTARGQNPGRNIRRKRRLMLEVK